MRTLGVDPGTYNMGVGVVDADGDRLGMAHADVLKAARKQPQHERLHRLYTALLDYISAHEPSAMAIEEPFVARNVRSAIAVGQAQAVAMMAAAATGIEVHTYAPRAVKQAITGYGGSEKEQVQEMVMLTLNMEEPPVSLDASDALAVAICHINASRASALTLAERL